MFIYVVCCGMSGVEPLHLVLAESALELVPREIWFHDVVKRHAKRRGKKPWEILLDKSVHYRAMLSLPEHHKRGRPDIVHISLLCALSSPLNRVGLLRVYVHTIDNRVIFVDPSTRLPRHYYRFVGLVEQLLIEGKVPPDSEKPLMWWKRMFIHELVNELKLDTVLLMHELGERISPQALGSEIAKLMREGKRVGVIVGCFPHGDFSEDTLRIASKRVSIFREPLDAWVVVSRVIEGVEQALNVYTW